MSFIKKPTWSFWGFVIGLLGIAIAVFLFFIRPEKEPDLKLVIEDEFSIIELKEKIPDLKIIYKSEDIVQQNKEIKVLIYSFVNEGKTILQNFYDTGKPFAIEFKDSQVLSTKVVASNSNYLEEDFLLSQTAKDDDSKGIVNFKKLIFESNKKITLKSYLLQNKAIEKTEISFLGKVAGIDNLPIEHKKPEIKKENTVPFEVRVSIILIYAVLGLLGILIGFKWRQLLHRER